MRGWTVVLTLVIAWGTWANEELPSALHEAEAAFQAGDYPRAETLFRTYLDAHPADQNADLAAYRAAEAALNQGHPQWAAVYLRHPALQKSPLRERAAFREAQAFYRLGQTDAAARRWRQLRLSPAEDLAAAAQLGLVWIALREERWSQARRELLLFHRMFPLHSLRQVATPLAGALARLPYLDYRSPKRARWMSTLVPGLGQIYAGRIGNGLGSFVLNALWIGGTVWALKQQRWVDAAFLTILGSRFYTGGRENAARFAAERNRRLREHLLAPYRSWEP